MAVADFLQQLAQAYMAKERARLGIPEQERAAAAEGRASTKARLDTAKAESELEYEPTRRSQQEDLTAAQIRNLDEPNRYPPQPRSPHYTTDSKGNVRAIEATADGYDVRDLGPIGTVQRDPQPASDRAAWTPQYDAGGNLKGFFHQGQYHPKEALGVPDDVRRPLSAGEKTDLSLLQGPARLPAQFRESLKQVRAAEGDSPVSAGTGVVMGNIGNVYRRMDTSGPGGDFDSARKQVRQVVYGLSGKQLNQSELDWLDSITPNLADPGVEEQINRLDAFISGLVEAKKSGAIDPFTTAKLSYGIQKPGAQAQVPGAPAQTKLINGVPYVKVPGGWQKQ